MKYSLFSLWILLFSFIIPNKNLRSCPFTLFAGPSWTFRSCTLLWRRILQNNNQLCYYCWRGKNVFLLNLFETRPIRRASTVIRSLSTNDCDGYENFAWKMKSRYFKIYRAYSIWFNSSSVGHFFWSWTLKDYRSSGKEKESRYLVCTSSTKREIRQFHVVVVQWR